MYCTQCGAQNHDSGHTCVSCGAPLRHPGVPQPVQQIPNYLVHSILATLFCCLPAGIVAIVYAAQVTGKIQAGDITGAYEASRNARTWMLVSVFSVLAIYVLAGVVAVIGAILGA